jgi:hypothetical protein
MQLPAIFHDSPFSIERLPQNKGSSSKVDYAGERRQQGAMLLL